VQTGIIRRLARYQGYGFIRCNEGRDIYFHRSELKGVTFDLLEEGQKVKSNISLSPRGFQAHNIELISKGG